MYDPKADRVKDMTMTNGQSDIDSCPDPITHDEAAKLTGKSVRTLRRWRSQGHLNGWTHDGRIWLSRAEVTKVAGLQAIGHVATPVQRRGIGHSSGHPVATPETHIPTVDNSKEVAILTELLEEVRADRNRLLERCQTLESRIAQLEAARDGDIKLLTENIKERSEGEAKLRSQIDTLADMLAEQEQELAAARKAETTEWRPGGVQ